MVTVSLSFHSDSTTYVTGCVDFPKGPGVNGIGVSVTYCSCWCCANTMIIEWSYVGHIRPCTSSVFAAVSASRYTLKTIFEPPDQNGSFRFISMPRLIC